MTTGMVEQLALFGAAEQGIEDAIPSGPGLMHISWSHSRRSTLEQCARRYYYEYFAANKRTAKHDPLKDEVHFLKNVQNRHLRTGQILHLVIGTYLRKAQDGEIQGVERLVSWARKIFATDRAYSRRYMDGGGAAHSEKYPPTLLWEYLSEDPQAEELCDEAEERLLVALRSFVTDDRYDPFRIAGLTTGSLVEHKLTLDDLPCRVTGKVDLAYEREGCVTVVDWKIGVGDGSGDDSLQLAVYALWATVHFSCDPAALRVCKVHFASDEIVDFRADAEVLAAARARILQDAERMAIMDDYGRAAVVDAFTPCGHAAVCRQCPFQMICPVGRGCAHA